jgi:hypothetical protein
MNEFYVALIWSNGHIVDGFMNGRFRCEDGIHFRSENGLSVFSMPTNGRIEINLQHDAEAVITVDVAKEVA